MDKVQRFSLPSRGQEETEPEVSRRTHRILLIEDNPTDASLIREALEEHAVRCELMLITDGARAVEFVQRMDEEKTPRPDLVILDINLPMVSGLEVLRRIRESRNCKSLQVVILTSSEIQQDKNEAAALGAFKYIAKPFRLDEFLRLGAVFKGILDDAAALS